MCLKARTIIIAKRTIFLLGSKYLYKLLLISLHSVENNLFYSMYK